MYVVITSFTTSTHSYKSFDQRYLELCDRRHRRVAPKTNYRLTALNFKIIVTDIRENSRRQCLGRQHRGSSVCSNETYADTSSEIINLNTTI